VTSSSLTVKSPSDWCVRPRFEESPFNLKSKSLLTIPVSRLDCCERGGRPDNFFSQAQWPDAAEDGL
jgi:hypothetical protein